MTKTISIILPIVAFLFFFFSCSSDNEPSKDDAIDRKTLFEALANFPDTILEDKNAKTNEFKLARQNDSLDLKLMKQLNGSWCVSNNEDISFLNTELNYLDTIIFDDETSVSMTGWGKITYNSSAKFYISKQVSHQYEFYITKERKLILTSIEYRNDDQSFKKVPEPKTYSFNFQLINASKVELTSLSKKFSLVKIKPSLKTSLS